MKKQNGITLIALVITIIVLLILAGVSIAMLTGENGILSKATKAGAETVVAEQKEQVVLAINALTTEYYDKKYVSNKDETQTLEHFVIEGLTAESSANNVSEYATVTAGADGETATIKTKATDNDGNIAKATYEKGKKLTWTSEKPTGTTEP